MDVDEDLLEAEGELFSTLSPKEVCENSMEYIFKWYTRNNLNENSLASLDALVETFRLENEEFLKHVSEKLDKLYEQTRNKILEYLEQNNVSFYDRIQCFDSKSLYHSVSMSRIVTYFTRIKNL